MKLHFLRYQHFFKQCYFSVLNYVISICQQKSEGLPIGSTLRKNPLQHNKIFNIIFINIFWYKTTIFVSLLVRI